ncbi:MAG: ATP-binding cassette subfamily F protein 3 [Flavobacterium sp.]|jgi:ATP-binding cassette subfamily F protein 3
MLSFTQVALRRGTELLFEDVTFTIHKGRKAGLIGANGAGKTSLFKMVIGELDSDHGELEFPNNLRIAHLEQEVEASDQSALNYVLSGDTEWFEIQSKLDAADKSGNYDDIGHLHERMDAIDGYTAKSRAEQLLAGLGFDQGEFGNSTNEFSGGWRIRLNLAKTLMTPSDLMLLDEPTNHLDLDTILWLVNWIKHYQGSLLVISHDREFLDETVDSIAYLHNKRVELFTGNYSQFELIKAARLAEQQSNFEKQQREVKHMQDFVRRFRAQATKARQAQSRIKALERMELIAPAHIDSPFYFKIPQSEKTSDPLLSLDQASLGYEDEVVGNVRLSLHPGDRIGLLGHNGAGKSTLVKSLCNEIKLLSGERHEGANLVLGYFSQHQVDDLDLDASSFTLMHRLDGKLREQEIRNYLGGFDFRGDKVHEPIRTFSGGEKTRLALAIVAFAKPNILLLDEPTNHLDMDMRQALTVALQEFNGAILVISHDRHLLANTVDSFLLIEDGKLHQFEGDLEDYRKRLFGEQTTSTPSPTLDTQKKQKKPKPDHKASRQLKTKILSLEKSLERLHRKLGEVDLALAKNTIYEKDNEDNLQNLIRDQMSLKDEIAILEEEWLSKTDLLEANA